MYRRAEHKWLEILIDCCHIGCASNSCNTFSGYQLSPSTADLVETFQAFRPILFRPRFLDIRMFCNWLSAHVRQSTHQQSYAQQLLIGTTWPSSKNDTQRIWSYSTWWNRGRQHIWRILYPALGLLLKGWFRYFAAHKDRVGSKLTIYTSRNIPSFKCLSFLQDLDRSRWDEIKRIAGTKDEELTDMSMVDRIDWRILGHLLSKKHHIKTHGPGNISVTVIGMDTTDYFAVIGSTNLSSIKDEILYRILCLVVPYGLGSTPRLTSNTNTT